MNRNGTISILLGLGIAGVLALSCHLARPRAGEEERPLVTLAGATASAARPKVASARHLAPLTGIDLVETALPEENDPGSAALQYRDGRIRRFAVRDWIDADTRLIGVSDASALFETRDEQSTLVLREARLPSAGEEHAPGLPGIDIDARPGTANPAIAR